MQEPIKVLIVDDQLDLAEELKNIIDTLDVNEALELVEIDQDVDLNFERNVYGT